MSHEDYNPEASKKKRHNLNLPQSSNGTHQLSEKTGAGKSLKNLKNKSSKNIISPILFSHLFKKQTKYK